LDDKNKNMKTLITILLTIIAIFILLFAAKGIFGFELKFEKQKSEVGNEKNIMPEETVSTTSSGQASSGQEIQDITELSAQIIQQGTGDRLVKAGDKITVHYNGMLLDGTKFDSSIDRGQPFSLTIGAGQVIQGWDQGIIGMKVGEQRRLFVPSELAYGEQGAGETIKPNDDLIFDVALISIDNNETTEPESELITEPITEPTPESDIPISTEENIDEEPIVQ